MTLNKLSNILKEYYSNSLEGEAVVQIHLFGIIYGKLIRENGISPKEIIETAKLNDSYVTELNKGIKLSEFVNFNEKNYSSIELGLRLKDIYEKTEYGQRVAQIHLFGIKYGKYIRAYNISLNEIILFSNINKSYLTELNKGVKLSEFVNVD